MSSRLIAMLVWGLAAASVVFWAMRLATTAAPIPDGARLAMNGPPAGGDLSRLLGAPRAEAGPSVAAPPPAASRFRLTGIVSTRNTRSHDGRSAPGVALISVDGAPARAYRVGDGLDSRLSLWSVALRSARIGDRSGSGTEAFVLELPPPTAPATGTLAAATSPRAPIGVAPNVPGTVYPPPAAVGNPQMAPTNPAFAGSPPAAFTLPGAPTMPSSDPAPNGAMPSLRQNDLGGAQSAPASNKQGVPNSAVMRQ